jgi:hypothetical protein
MARTLSAVRILRIAVKVGAIADSAVITASGSARWRRNELAVVNWLTKEQGHLLTWSTHIGDAKLGPAMAKYGSLSVTIGPVTPDAIEWPSEPSVDLEAYLRDGIGRSSEFISDREDLCSVLASYGNVTRGRFYAWLSPASYPARLVQALIIARDMGASQHISVIEQRLGGDPVVLSSGESIDILPAARRWARQYAEALEDEITI